MDKDENLLTRLPDALISLMAGVLGATLAFHYPIAQPLPLLIFAAVVAMAANWPWMSLFALPAALPVIGLAPWTGWITFDETDMLVLGLLAGGYGFFAWRPVTHDVRWPRFYWILVSLFAISVAVSMGRGLADAGGFVFGWFQGYHDPMISVRIAKPFFWAVLVMPLWARCHRMDSVKTVRLLGWGLVSGLTLVALATVWERIAYTDLLNFSTDYRTTALFWEMHIGGAALDGWLVLTMPFLIWLARRGKTHGQQFLAYVPIGLAAYACLTTFSRGVYLALVLSLPLLGLLLVRERSGHEAGGLSRQELWRFVVVMVGFGVMTSLAFPTSGYRGLLALMGIAVIGMPVVHMVRKAHRVGLLLFAAASGLVIGVGLALFAGYLPKGPYLLYALLFVPAAMFAYFPWLAAMPGSNFILTTAFATLFPVAVSVATYWGGDGATSGMLWALVVLAIVLALVSSATGEGATVNARAFAARLVVGTLSCAVAAVFLGGSYMGDRFSTSSSDVGGRLNHWSHATGLMQTEMDFLFGKGLGRFPPNYYFAAPEGALPGAFRLRNEDGNNYLSLSGARHVLGWGEILRISQRLPLSSEGPFNVGFRIRTKAEADIHLEVCEKHLLYNARCALASKRIKGQEGEWQSVELTLGGDNLEGFSVLTPRFKVFSIGVATPGGAVDLDDLKLATRFSSSFLVNGDFSDDMARWFFSSDRDHMPWHTKNLMVNVFFDQGLFGILTFGLLVVVALWSLNRSKGMHSELAPYLSSGICGFLIVGLFDSLIDVSRLALLFYLLLLYSIGVVAAQAKAGRMHSRSLSRDPEQYTAP